MDEAVGGIWYNKPALPDEQGAAAAASVGKLSVTAALPPDAPIESVVGIGSISAIGVGYDAEDNSDEKKNSSAVESAPERPQPASANTDDGSPPLPSSQQHAVAMPVSRLGAFGVTTFGALWNALAEWRTEETEAFLANEFNVVSIGEYYCYLHCFNVYRKFLYRRMFWP